MWQIDYLNKSKGFRQDTKKFKTLGQAKKWGKKNLDNFNMDMIR